MPAAGVEIKTSTMHVEAAIRVISGRGFDSPRLQVLLQRSYGKPWVVARRAKSRLWPGFSLAERTFARSLAKPPRCSALRRENLDRERAVERGSTGP